MEEIKDLIEKEDYDKYKKLLQEFECKAIDTIETLTWQFREELAEEIDDKIKGWKKESERLLKENWVKDDKIKKLEQELAELKEKAIVVPVKLGDTIYVIPSETNYRLNIAKGKEEQNKVYEWTVSEIRYNKYGFSVVCDVGDVQFYCNYEPPKNLCGHFDTEKYYGETWFTTRAEAQAKLQELQNGDFSGE